jgi:transposase
MFQIPSAGSVYLYQKPINMRWGEKKLTQLCRDEMGIDPRAGGAFLFYNSKRDQLKLFFLDHTGSQEFQKWMPRGGFLLPAPRDGEQFVKVDRKKLLRKDLRTPCE